MEDSARTFVVVNYCVLMLWKKINKFMNTAERHSSKHMPLACKWKLSSCSLFLCPSLQLEVHGGDDNVCQILNVRKCVLIFRALSSIGCF